VHGVEDYRPVWEYKNWREEQGLADECTTHGLFGDVDAGCPENASSLAWQADQVIEQIGKFRDGPFFVRWDPPEPHLPCRPTPAFAERFADRAIPPWQSFPDSLKGKPAAQRRQLRIWGLEGWTWEQWLPVVRLYYGIIAEMDHHIGRVLDRLEALGLADDTLVIYSTDHGDYCGGHGQMDKHFNMYDDVTRVPLIIRHPGTRSAGSVCDAFASNSIDIAATILAAAGIDRPESFVGHDLARMAADTEFRPRPHAFAQYFGTESGASSIRMLRDRRFKFVYHPTGDCHEFYDLEADPGELCNRIADPALAVEIRRMQAELWHTMKECGDRLANRWTETELCGRAPMAHEAGLGEGE
jgi:arylsulfatase A-like enzyme